MARPFVLLHFPRNLFLVLSLEPLILHRCSVRSSLAGRVKFTNPYGAPRATSAPVLVLTSKIRPARSFFLLFVVFQTTLFLHRFPPFHLPRNSRVFIYPSTSSTGNIQPKFFYRAV